MSRQVFEKIQQNGFQSSKIESASATLNGQKIYVGSSEGSIQLYDGNSGSKSNIIL